MRESATIIAQAPYEAASGERRARYRAHASLRTRLGPGAALALALAGIAGCGRGGNGGGRPVTIVVSGDTAGWIVPCGCTSNQSGGLLRRGTYVGQLRRESEVVLADVGGAPAGERPYDRARFEAILSGEKDMGIAAHNLGAAEARLGGAYLREVSQRRGVPFVSANLRDAQGLAVAPPVRVVDAGGLRVVLIGVVSERFAGGGLSVDPPQRAVLDALQNVRPRGDVVIVLAYAPENELNALAGGLPEVDAVIGGPTGQAIRPRLAGRVIVAAATNKGKFLVRLDDPRFAEAKGTNNAGDKTSKTWSGDVVEMTDRIADDPDQRKNVDQFYALLAKRDFAPRETSLVANWPAEFPKNYRVAGNRACRACHGGDYDSWQSSPHARAWQTLVVKGAQVDASCQQCHTLAYALPGGFQSPRRTPDLVNVGCENCHGPSQSHASDPRTHTAYFATAGSRCTTCHDAENSPRFAFETYWPRIRHGQTKAAGKPDAGGRETSSIPEERNDHAAHKEP